MPRKRGIGTGASLAAVASGYCLVMLALYERVGFLLSPPPNPRQRGRGFYRKGVAGSAKGYLPHFHLILKTEQPQ